ncbi:hypothetical protein BFW01_g569 [Lasiodiplodia theobromae]|nr:hypothetical protein BFW01_g569 [Lasiodiplodia theobromae]
MHFELWAHIIIESLALFCNRARLEGWPHVRGAKADFSIREDTNHLLHGIGLGTRKPRTEPLSKKGLEVNIVSERAYLQAAAVQADEDADTLSEDSGLEEEHGGSARTNAAPKSHHYGRTIVDKCPEHCEALCISFPAARRFQHSFIDLDTIHVDPAIPSGVVSMTVKHRERWQRRLLHQSMAIRLCRPNEPRTSAWPTPTWKAKPTPRAKSKRRPWAYELEKRVE